MKKIKTRKKMNADIEKTKNKLALAKTIIFHMGQKTMILQALSATTASNIQAQNQKQKKLVMPSTLFLLLMTTIKL